VEEINKNSPGPYPYKGKSTFDLFYLMWPWLSLIRQSECDIDRAPPPLTVQAADVLAPGPAKARRRGSAVQIGRTAGGVEGPRSRARRPLRP